MIFLNSYNPLVKNVRGKSAIREYGIPPYVDNSCRREPDFESAYPSITALCRGRNFAPRINESDVIVYVTTKGKYSGYSGRHWRLAAILEVVRRFESHREASNWYINKELELPRNCIVGGNHPLLLEMTSNRKSYSTVEQWDTVYKMRARKYGVFLSCKPIFMELHSPPVITEEAMFCVFGKIPSTQTPPRISDEEYNNLRRMIGI